MKCVSTFLECDYRYILQAKLEDPTTFVWATAFDEAATKLVGLPAKDLYMLQFNHATDATAEEVVRHLQYNQFLFTLSANMETYGSETRMKTTIVDIYRVDFTNELNYLLQEIGLA